VEDEYLIEEAGFVEGPAKGLRKARVMQKKER